MNAASKSVSISKTLDSIPDNVALKLLAAHCLSGCDTVS